ncbi:MAG: 2,3,4,5-tetrahydropyridine-2,6-dicarboxylate N-succinyltransferase [Holosporaceae bacterium]|jgi:2,3,4,5-tetrahydropyridine-2-carboxylate N-succinyltransferase|nr:2,3,4,5-tetrahydropyridine-2,6-dicarboxylate N-succinyltransferase [Holosporaceae bacterium]
MNSHKNAGIKMENLENKIEKLWNGQSDDVSCICEAMESMNIGKLRVANKIDGQWKTNEYLKKAILLFFEHRKSKIMHGSECEFFDKVPLKTKNWSETDFIEAGFRAVPGSLIRYSAYVAKSVVIMPSFINVGAYVDEGSLVDTNALVGSCAQIGKNCHISDGVTIGGVLEPLQANPVIVEDGCFLGVRSCVTEGVIIGEGAVLGAGTILTSSTKILDRETGKISYGKIPPYSVVVPGAYASGNVNISCAVIAKHVDEGTRQKTSVNDILRLL